MEEHRDSESQAGGFWVNSAVIQASQTSECRGHGSGTEVDAN